MVDKILISVGASAQVITGMCQLYWVASWLHAHISFTAIDFKFVKPRQTPNTVAATNRHRHLILLAHFFHINPLHAFTPIIIKQYSYYILLGMGQRRLLAMILGLSFLFGHD